MYGVGLVFLLLAILNFAALGAEDAATLREKIDAALIKGADALWKLQAEDGGWHSRTYGHLKPGVATTAFVLETLVTIDKDRHAADFVRAEKFLIAAQGKDGGLGTAGEWLEYPTYSTALGILAFTKLKPEGWVKTIEPWVKYLKAAQHSEENGCKPEDKAYGGWAPEGVYVKGRGRGSNISATRYALEALFVTGNLAGAQKRAEQFARSSQNWNGISKGDGGFFFSPAINEQNKAGRVSEGGAFVSYGSATSEGIVCWRLLGAGEKYPPIPARGSDGHWMWTYLNAKRDALKAARDWIVREASFEKCPGFDEKDSNGWAKGLTFYYRAATSEALLKLDTIAANPVIAWQEKIATPTIALQREEGTFKNTSILMKEDDPLIATPLALKTLWNCRTTLEIKEP